MQDTRFYDPPPLSYDIRGLMKATGKGRTTIFEDIAAGKLRARKAGGKLIVLYDDAKAWLHSLPVRESSKREAVTDAS